MSVENNHTAESEREQTQKNGSDIEETPVRTNIGDEDEDVHKCGRCQSEFSALEAFIQHKQRHSCRRLEAPGAAEAGSRDEATAAATEVNTDQSPGAPGKSPADDESFGLLGRGRRKKTTSLKVKQSDGTEGSTSIDDIVKLSKVCKVNPEGRYICQLCEKTFKTSNILKTHMKTHSDQKNFSCDLCGASFRTKGSLIRHNRRHTDERPYRCDLCGQSFRESGALNRHLKALTPCTEKIRFVQYKEILVNRDGIQKGVGAEVGGAAGQPEVLVVEQQPEEQGAVETQTAVVSLVEPGSQEVIHQVHFTMEVDGTAQEQQVVVEQSQAEALVVEQSQAEALVVEQSQAEALAAAAGDNLICQAIINSDISLRTEETVAEELAEEAEETEKVFTECPGDEESVTEIQVKEEFVETEAEQESGDGDGPTSSKLHTCPHCHRSFKGLNYFRFHVRGHLGSKPFKCTLCQREFLSGYLLKKHMEVHVSERRYKCGECGKLYKTVAHVREHMRAHSDERPYRCVRCNKGYKTKVHQRTHGDEKPYVCHFCLRGFREKGSLVRHIRHHTGEKPFKCPKCGRGFAEHGTLNRHLRAKGGCHRDQTTKHTDELTEEEEAASVDGLATAAVISEDPHAVLVEFSSVVADTQEYIIKTQTEDEEQGEQVTLIQDSQNEMGQHIMKVVQQLVSQSQGAGGSGSHQIIVRNVGANEDGPTISDCGDTITIATPESLTEQVAMTLASAISDGTLLATATTIETDEGGVAMVAAEEEEGMEVVQQQEEYVITSPDGVEIQTVVV